MIGPPRTAPLLFERLVENVGGVRLAARILHVTPRTVRRWLADQAPHLAADLLWYASPIGRYALTVDQGNLIATLHSLTDSLSRRLAAAERECIALAAALDQARGRVAANDSRAYASQLRLQPRHVGAQPIELRSDHAVDRCRRDDEDRQRAEQDRMQLGHHRFGGSAGFSRSVTASAPAPTPNAPSSW